MFRTFPARIKISKKEHNRKLKHRREIRMIDGSASDKKILVQSTLMESAQCSILSDEEDSHIVYTIGYEGRTPDDFIDILKCHRIQRLIDVRERALSRKKGFSKTALARRLEEEGIEYIHLRSLGAPLEIRHEYKNGGSRKVFFEKYGKHIDEEVPEEFDLLKNRISEKTSVLMCFELSYLQCHRKILAEKLEDSGFRVKHL